MSVYLYNEFKNNVFLMPLRGLQFVMRVAWGNSRDLNIIIYNLEAESNIKITPITKTDDSGTIRRLGYKYEANVYIPHNDFKNNNLIFLLEGILNEKYVVSFVLGNQKCWSEQEHEAPSAINANNAMRFTLSSSDVNYSIEIETIEFRPRMILRFQGFIKDLSSLTF